MEESNYYLFGWGTYVNPRRYGSLSEVEDIKPVRVEGMKRAWGAQDKQNMITVLGGYLSDQDKVNGLLYKISEEDYARHVEREESAKFKKGGLVRFDITPSQVEFTGEKFVEELKSEDKIFTFIHENYAEPNDEYPVTKSYLDVVIDGTLDFGDDFLDEFMLTTSGWIDILDDTEDPRYKKASGEKRTEEIDKTLDKYNIKVK